MSAHKKEGASIAPKECERILHKYMYLDGRHSRWIRLQQVFWIRYMRRRSRIFPPYERFNKNKDLSRLGGTTFAVMLEEAQGAHQTTARWTGTAIDTHRLYTGNRPSPSMVSRQRTFS